MEKYKKAIGYCRTSLYSNDSDVAKDTLEYQHERIVEGAKQARLEIVKWWNAHDKDDKLAEILTYCTNNPQIQYLAISRHDRISRTQAKHLRWRKAFNSIGVQIIVLPDTAENRYLFALMELQAIQHSKLRSAAIKRGIQARKERKMNVC